MLGDAWVDEQQSRNNPALSIGDRHPLAVALGSQTEDSVVEVLQLAAYFCAFQHDLTFGEILAALRNSEQYGATILELDIAWKFREAGARVRLAPATPRGKADFAAEVNGKEHAVEVSTFPSDPLRGVVFSFHDAMTSALAREIKRAGLAINIAIEIDAPEVTGSIRQPAYAAVREVIDLFAKGNARQRIERRYQFGSVAVRPALPNERPYGGSAWTMVSRTGRTPLTSTRLLGDTDYSIRRGGSLVYLRDRSINTDPLVRLARKLKTEATQVSGCEDAVLVIEAEGLGPDLFNDKPSLDRVIERFGRNHTSTTAIAVVTQPVKINGTRGVSGHYYQLKESALSVAFWQRLLEQDDRSNILAELRALSSV
jgi:hypothetical protein